MTDKQQVIDDLFSMFHDFEITALTYDFNKIDLTIQIPWGQLWDELNYYIKIELTGCDFIHCDYAELLNTPDNLAKRWVDRSYIDKSTIDPKIISKIGLKVQRHEFYLPNKYKFICNSSKDYAGGQLTFTTDNYKIFNKDGIQIELQQMEKWCREWWDNIQKT